MEVGKIERRIRSISRVQISVGIGVFHGDRASLHLLDWGERQVIGIGSAVCANDVVWVSRHLVVRLVGLLHLRVSHHLVAWGDVFSSEPAAVGGGGAVRRLGSVSEGESARLRVVVGLLVDAAVVTTTFSAKTA